MLSGSDGPPQPAWLQKGITNLCKELIPLEEALLERNLLSQRNMVAHLTIKVKYPTAELQGIQFSKKP